MPVLLLIGIPLAVVVLLFAILSLPDEEIKDELASVTKKISKGKKK